MAYLDLNSYSVNVKWLPFRGYESDSMIITVNRLQVKIYPKQPYAVRYIFDKNNTPKEELVINRPYLIDVLTESKDISRYLTVRSKTNDIKMNYNRVITDTKNRINMMFENGDDIISMITNKIDKEEKAVY